MLFDGQNNWFKKLYCIRTGWVGLGQATILLSWVWLDLNHGGLGLKKRTYVHFCTNFKHPMEDSFTRQRQRQSLRLAVVLTETDKKRSLLIIIIGKQGRLPSSNSV